VFLLFRQVTSTVASVANLVHPPQVYHKFITPRYLCLQDDVRDIQRRALCDSWNIFVPAVRLITLEWRLTPRYKIAKKICSIVLDRQNLSAQKLKLTFTYSGPSLLILFPERLAYVIDDVAINPLFLFRGSSTSTWINALMLSLLDEKEVGN